LAILIGFQSGEEVPHIKINVRRKSMTPKETCERFSMWLNAVRTSSETHLPVIQRAIESGDHKLASSSIDEIRTTIDDMLSSFDRILKLNEEPPYSRKIPNLS
jgi:hypothetical protein